MLSFFALINTVLQLIGLYVLKQNTIQYVKFVHTIQMLINASSYSYFYIVLIQYNTDLIIMYIALGVRMN